METTQERPIQEMLAEVDRIASIQEIQEICIKLGKDLEERKDIPKMTNKEVKDLLISYKQCLYKTQHQLT